MAEHYAEATMKNLDIGQAGSAIEVKIWADGNMLGTLRIGHGSIGWKKSRGKKFIKKKWTQLKKWFEE